MKILVLSSDFPLNSGGVASFIQILSIQFYSCGNKLDVITKRRDDSDTFDQTQPYRIYHYSEQRRLSPLLPITKSLILGQSNRYDVVFMSLIKTQLD